jgi:signal-transduction protein with cAMP-binding, CBS, and nucleotidyltransferase domain
MEYFMSKFEFIRDITDQSFKDIIKTKIKIATFGYNYFVYKVGDPVKNIYFIKKGQVEVNTSSNFYYSLRSKLSKPSQI